MLKPTVIFILVICISGYLYCSRTYRNIVKLEKSEGYHTFFISASWGLVLFVIAYVITSIVSLMAWAQTVGAMFKSAISILLSDIAQNTELLNLLSVFLVTLLLGYFVPIIINLYSDHKENDKALLNEWKRCASSDDSPEFSTLCFNSIEYGLPIAFTLSNKKVYIGYAMAFGIKANDILLLPIVSGYRCNERLDFIPLINYEPVIKFILNRENPKNVQKALEKFLISIPHREVVHANLHDLSYREHFNKYKFDDTQHTEQSKGTVQPKVGYFEKSKNQ